MSNFSVRKKAVLALIIANVIWGAASPIFKYSLENIPPFTLAFLRFSIAALILLPFIHKRIHNLDQTKSNWKEILAYALSGVTLNIIFFFLGLELTESINAPIIGSAGPIAIIILSAIFLKEKISTKKIIGVSIAFFGVVIIVVEPIIKNGFDGSILGNMFLVLATIGAVIQTLVGRDIARKYHVFTLTFWSFIIGSITFFPLAIPEIKNMPSLDIRALVGVFYGAVFSSTLGYTLYAWGLSKIEASEVGIFAYLDPVVAIIIAYPLLGEIPDIFYLIGSVFVFGGIFIAEKRIHYHPIHKLFKL